MELAAARTELARALSAASSDTDRPRAARAVLSRFGISVLGLSPRAAVTLEEIVRTASEAPASEASRSFAVLLIDALAVPGLTHGRGASGQHVRQFLERALLNPLRRAGYPFAGSAYEKDQFLSGLHASINDHLHPPEPSIPRWLHGLEPSSQD